jgi:PAS domain S-box-containing protein
MYKGVIVNGIQRPYEMLVLDLKKVGKNLESEIQLRSLMEEVISKNEQCIGLFINKASDGIIVEKGQNLIYVNSKAANILGADNILDLYNNESFSEDFKMLTFKQRESAMRHKSEMPFAEYQMKTCDGETVDIECSTNYIIYGGAPALMHMFRDISHRKKITSLEKDIKSTELKLYQSNELNRVLTEFFSNVSHELRTPLNIISSASQLLQHCNPDRTKEKTNNLLNIINQNTFRLIRIINNLIDVSKYDSGYLNLNLRNYNIVTMIEDITLSVVEYANIKGLEIIFDTDVEEKIMAVDDDKIERIMLNLISNSIKFTNRGGKIMVSLEDKDEQLRITVKDTGIGIPKDKIDLIFERFGQVDKSLKRNREGSGIGLSLVKTFVEMHGGNIYVESKYNKGSEFVIDLPVKTVKGNAKIDYSIGNKVEKIKIEFSDIYPDSLPLSS